ncbi:unnamed protein product [Heligmosomoides polygyrus]|uniref:Uncharacterized protein n=1 Tax=Heligmosomoides polygyrus TaxID=6339 RepID=A0A183GKD6_HELPZ|nr:unnamed protein product [Heligmosomoides polygyrus]
MSPISGSGTDGHGDVAVLPAAAPRSGRHCLVLFPGCRRCSNWRSLGAWVELSSEKREANGANGVFVPATVYGEVCVPTGSM